MSSSSGEGQQSNPASGSPKMPWSLARRLTFWYLGWFFTLGCVVTGFYYGGMTRDFAEVDDGILLERIQVLSGLLSKGKAAESKLKWEVESEPEEVEGRYLYVRILDASGVPIIQTSGMSELLPPEAFPSVQDPGTRTSVHVRGPAGRVFAVMSTAVTGRRIKEKWIIQVAYDRTTLEAALKKHESMMAVVLVVGALAALGFGHWIVWIGLRPLRDIVDATRRIQSSTLSQRLYLKDPAPEVASLAKTFNEMLERLDKSFVHVSKFSGDIAHELRTPLANLRGEAEVALSKERTAQQYREVLASSLEEYEHVSGVIERLLFLSRAENSEGCLEKKLVNVGEELASIAGFFEPAATEMNLGIRLAANGDVCMNADPVLMRRAVCNLVSNAMAHTPPGGTIGLAAYKQKSSIRVIVADSGIGIPAEHLPHVFDRFYRVSRTPCGRRGGAGLGLSIVQTVMNLHQGLVEISSAPGRGTCVILEFPLTANS